MSTHNHQLSRRSTLARGAAGIIKPSLSSSSSSNRTSSPGRPDKIRAPRHPTFACRASVILAEAENITLDDKEEVDEDGVRRQPGDVIADREKMIEDEKVEGEGGYMGGIEDTVIVRPSRGEKKWTKTIQVASEDPQKLAVHPKNSWIANILELRAKPNGDKYALVLWLYWPSDLKNARVGEEYPKDGRKGYHGDYELVVSNYLDIMDVRTFDRVFTEEDVRLLLGVDGEVVREYYWRQSYDVRDGSLSELPRYCKCNKFWKPDTILLQSPSDTCAKWMHPECIIGDVLLKKWKTIAYTSGRSTIGRAKTGPRDDRNSAFVDHSSWAHRLSGKINEEKTKVVVLDKRGREDTDDWLQEVSIRCLFCAESFVQEVKEG